MKKVGMYARVSPGRQEEEQTIESQIDAIEKRVAAMGEVLDPEHRYIDDGWTSASLLRPGLEGLRDAVARGDLDCVVIHDPDRLSRRYLDQQIVLEEIERKQVEVVFVLGGVAHTDEDRMALQMRGVFAEYERAKIRERTRRGRLHRARAGAVPGWATPPYGYRYIPGDKPHTGTVVIEECEATIVRQIFEWVGTEGLRLRQVVLRLEEQGVKPRSGKHWAHTTLMGIVHNGVYIGRAHHYKYESVEPKQHRDNRRYRRRIKTSNRRRPEHEWIIVNVPAIVNEELFMKAQQRLRDNRRRTAGQPKHPYLLRGLLFCSACGRKLWGFASLTGRGDAYRYYSCNARDRFAARYDERCPCHPMRADDVEKVVWEDLARWLQEPEQLATQLEAQREKVRTVLEAYAAEQRRLARDMRAVTQAIERLVDAYQAGAISLEELRGRRERLEESKQQCQARIADAERDHEQALAQRHVADEIRDLKERLRHGLERCSWEDRRAIVELLVEKVEVAEPTLRVHYVVPLGRGPQSSGAPSEPTEPGGADSEKTGRHGPRFCEPWSHDLDGAQRDAGFEEVGGVAVTQGVDRGVLLEAGVGASCNESLLQGGLVQVSRAVRGDEEERGGGARALGLPVPAQTREQRARERDAAVLGALAIAHPHREAGTVDVAGLEPEPLVEAQAESVDGGEGHAPHGVAHGAEHGAHLLRAEDDGEHARLVDTKDVEDAPVTLHGVDEEEAKRVKGDVDGRGRELLVLSQVEEVGADIVVGDGLRLARRAVHELSHREGVGLLGPRPEVPQPHVLAHPLPPGLQRHHDRLRGTRGDDASPGYGEGARTAMAAGRAGQVTGGEVRASQRMQDSGATARCARFRSTSRWCRPLCAPRHTRRALGRPRKCTCDARS